MILSLSYVGVHQDRHHHGRPCARSNRNRERRRESIARASNPWFLYRKGHRSVVRVHGTHGCCMENAVGALVFIKKITFGRAKLACIEPWFSQWKMAWTDWFSLRNSISTKSFLSESQWFDANFRPKQRGKEPTDQRAPARLIPKPL